MKTQIWKGELTAIYQIIEDVANCKAHPKCKKLQLGKSKIQGYEAKSKHLRTYFFHEKGTGQIVVIGGTKKNQVQDIDRLKKIIKEYQRFKEGKNDLKTQAFQTSRLPVVKISS